MKKYLVHPGRIKSKTDGDMHYIGFMRLVELYGVNLAECINADNVREPARPKGLIDLFPDYHGNYTLPR